MDKLNTVNEENNNIHHLFTHKEVKMAILRMLGEPITTEDYENLDRETGKAWRRLPKYMIEVEKHNDLHKDRPIPVLDIKNVLSKKIIAELVEGGIKSFEVDKKEKVISKSSLVKRIVGQIYGYIHNYEGIREELKSADLKDSENKSNTYSGGKK